MVENWWPGRSAEGEEKLIPSWVQHGRKVDSDWELRVAGNAERVRFWVIGARRMLHEPRSLDLALFEELERRTEFIFCYCAV